MVALVLRLRRLAAGLDGGAHKRRNLRPLSVQHIDADRRRVFRLSVRVVDAARLRLRAAKQFLRVESLVARLGRRARAASELLAALVGLTVALVCVYATGTLLLAAWRFGTVSIQPSATPLWIPQLALPLAFAWLCVLYVHQIVVTLVRGPAVPVAHPAEPVLPGSS
ncbi:MAG: TRAP transporter small permease subunit [Betaproteobacteria bacterium]|nr:MAG: TRAP transporter small permease subunit [Betaproteobacteria bacterium]